MSGLQVEGEKEEEDEFKEDDWGASEVERVAQGDWDDGYCKD